MKKLLPALCTSGNELLKRLGHYTLLQFALAIYNLVWFAVVHFQDGDEVVRVARIYGLRSSQAGSKS